MIAVGVILVAMILLLALAVAIAPKGHEDENGFHYDDDSP